MLIKEFQSFVREKTIKGMDTKSIQQMALMGLAGETGELIDEMKKHYFYDKPKNINNLKEEAGDILHYILMLLNTENIPVEEIIQLNIDKISKRYHTNVSKEEALVRVDKK